ncbi:uncharacterized protein NECHADRAFT_80690 [Fusarium vanettenii 77-13-4]|uniref:Uncharacterized protein n=1 Tax=Fusarium vanettenii (strain ATCC MYA-4622 / CBS 123669 / FGSC 9596 / NRRL 45880 / 77-13-4) TaxID=660122 RepID=C7YSC5_FUSV7|nr:uncharacterized protein NECHADRAFT_80690 [Fusarium vanettenii 77-13-4]EEU45612.1 hypothetical protein NECHADRAFT_80690 [Fusarium vanettenii 77-13-4]
MGCSHSQYEREMESRPVRPVTISDPMGGPVMIPPMFRDETGRPIQYEASSLSRRQIINAFEHMAEYLDQCGIEANVVVVGGAVNTVYLGSRESTHDVDFFLEDPASKEYMSLDLAAKFANRQAEGRLGEEWFNNSTQLFMARDVQTSLVRQAKRQNAVVFEKRGAKGGLKVYAAPWTYAVCSKLNRLCEINPRSYDMDDAVVYLNRHLILTAENYVKSRELYDWCRRYSHDVRPEILKQLDEKYLQSYGYKPIVWT